LVVLCVPLFPQSKFELSGGLGFPDMLNIGLKYGSKIQIGASYGVLPRPQDNIIKCSSLVLFYHFAGNSKFTTQPPWYLNGGISYIHSYYRDRKYDIDWKAICLYPRIGRTNNFTKKIGINIDIGVIFSTGYNYFEGIHKFDIMPSGSISLFHRILPSNNKRNAQRAQ
jgi:hypothetical protein